MDLDSMLKDLGHFGKFQAFSFTMIMFPVILCGYRSTEYIFTTMSIPHRCRIPECEGSTGPTEYERPWLKLAVPYTAEGSVPNQCLRFKPLHASSSPNLTYCSAANFNYSVTETCNEWVFSEPTRTIANDFNIMCPEDLWKLTFLSSVFVISSSIGLPLAGIISDRIGRKTVLVFGCAVWAISGVIRSLSVNYTMLITFELLDGMVCGAIYTPAFVLALEILCPKKRLLGSLLVNFYFTLGEVILVFVMWTVGDWRIMQRVLYTPMLATVALFWLLPESVRWLYTQQRFEDIEKIFRRIAKMNNSEDKLPEIINKLQSHKLKDKDMISKENQEKPVKTGKLRAVFRSRIIMGRVLACAGCWVAALFTYYGISQSATLFKSNNRYISFLLVSLVELPAYVASLWLPDWQVLGRQGSSAWSFFVCGVASIILTFITHEQVMLSLILFLLAKFCSTLTLTVLYVYTAEVFPTEVRHSLLSFCSMIGRVGAILSQQTPLLIGYFDPMILFAAVAITGGLLTLTCPETLNTTLPNTIEEAEKIGKIQPDLKQNTTIQAEMQKY